VSVWPQVQWSFSALEAFERCAMQFGEVNVRKKYPFVESEQMKAGNQVHKMLEDYVTIGTPLPAGLTHIKAHIDKLCVGALNVQAEQSVALTWDLEPCGTFDFNVSYRGKLDLTVSRPDALIVTDYKTSSEPREGLEQLELSCLAALQRNKQYDVAWGVFAYTKHKFRKVKVLRSDIPLLAATMVPRLERLKEAKEKGLFPATPGFQCRWCPVVTCEHNPKHKSV
jgi:PD-(D/E)XK nuclease superfamily